MSSQTSSSPKNGLDRALSTSEDNSEHKVFETVDLSKAPMSHDEVKERLVVLDQLDSKIVQLLDSAATAIDALGKGKTSQSQSETDEAKSLFQSSSKQYHELLEEVSIKLRQEIRLLHHMSKEKVLPMSLSAKADWVGREKEKEVWETIEKLLRDGQEDDKEMTDITEY
jgi:hypothetical protein